MGNIGEWEVKRDTRIGPPPSLPFSTMPSCRLGETNGLHPTMYHMAVQRPGPGDQVAAASSTTLYYQSGLAWDWKEERATPRRQDVYHLRSEPSLSMAYCAPGRRTRPYALDALLGQEFREV